MLLIEQPSRENVVSVPFHVIRRMRNWIVGFLCVCASPAINLEADDATSRATFEKQIAPILAAKCVSCHRPDNLKGNLDLSTHEGTLKGGDSGASLTPSDPASSLIYTRSIAAKGQRPEMPAKGDPLTADEAELVRKWIADGAAWPEGYVIREKSRADRNFWSFQPLAKVVPPAATDAAGRQAGHPVDQFVLKVLQGAGMQMNPPAPPRVWIRRATYDLTGLPPTPDEVTQFIADCEQRGMDAAVETAIDRLLVSPRYGEAWGRHWLDVIRFGESRGYERNEIITNLWPFRDYVIRSFNADKPFDQFIHEHLAGDVIAPDQPEIEVGSAFLVAGPYDDVGNQDPVAAAQIRADQMDEMIRATSEAFLGLTMGCARCHDHKFDPLPTRDYYSLYATFSGTSHGPREVATREAKFERQQRLEPLQAERSKLITERNELEKAIADQIKAMEADFAKRWVRPKISRYGTEESFPPIDARFIKLVVDGPDSTDPNRKQFKLDEFEVWSDDPTPKNVALATNGSKAVGVAPSAKDFSGAYSADLVIDGKLGECWLAGGGDLTIEFPRVERIHRAIFSSDRTRALPEDSGLTVFVGDYRIEASIDGQAWTKVASSDDRLPVNDTRRDARIRKLATTEEQSRRRDELNQAIGQLDQKIAQVPGLPVWWVGHHPSAPGPFQVFIGGSPQKKGEDVLPVSLSVFDGLASNYKLDSTASESARRLTLAKWLTSSDQPLVPRVLVNRIWQHHFGTGIVSTPSDFGYMGSRPSHPELLDWLAGELQRNGWKLKPLHRLIMTSAAYRQSSAWNEANANKDAESRLLWRFPPHRLTAEELRDTMLVVGGKLNLEMGGPGFRLYEYQQDNVATYVPLDDPGPETFRRSVYHHNARASRVDMLTDFDCPDPAFAEPRRATTITPLQALTMMNHRFPFRMATEFAERLERDASTPTERIQRAFQLAFSREPDERELAAGLDVVQKSGLRALCRAILNSNEQLTVD